MVPRLIRYRTFQDTDGVWNVVGLDYEIAVWGEGRERQEKRFRAFVRETFPGVQLRFQRLRAELLQAQEAYRSSLFELEAFIQRHRHMVVWDFRALEVAS